MNGSRTLELVSLAATTAAVAGVLGALALWLLRSRSIGTQVVIVALSAITGTAVGARVAADAMLLSSDDLVALDVVLGAAGGVGLLAAVLLGRRVGRAGASLVAVARRVGEPAGRHVPARDAPRELARLARELDETSTRLHEARVRERALDRSRRELVAWVSHDLRTPLAGIRAIAEALEDGLADDEATTRRYYRTLREEAERISRLVDDLFELSRAQAGVLDLHLERISLADVVSDALAAAGPLAAAEGVQLEGRLDGPTPELMGSTPELLRVLRNLLANAIRHTPAGGSVSVTAFAEGSHAYLTIADTGGGIAERDLPRVFDVAYRADPARRKGDGAGLGLAIARSLVEAHRGEIDVRNDDGGARFTIRLPLEATGAK